MRYLNVVVDDEVQFLFREAVVAGKHHVDFALVDITTASVTPNSLGVLSRVNSPARQIPHLWFVSPQPEAVQVQLSASIGLGAGGEDARSGCG